MVFQFGTSRWQNPRISLGGNELEGRFGRIDIGSPGYILFKYIVLDGSVQVGPIYASLFGQDQIHGQDRCRRRVYCHGDRDPVQRYVCEEKIHILE